ncbi:MAG TPA: hypothetical protein VLL76_03865 [Candidatus Omnitrophota bacterium]|nr:hypothetical protein [Candidatus Omnitrophota bacterium]
MTAACPTRSCHSISEIVITVVRALMRERAVDGKVDIEDVDRILQLLGRGTVAMDNAFQLQEEKCRKIHSKPKGNVGARSNPFQRLIVRPFEHLLMGEGAVFQRGWLPNYFEFIDHALATNKEAYERDCRAVIQALLVVHGNNLTWDHFYSDVRTLKVLHAALKELTHVLSTPAGTKLWGGMLLRPCGDLPAPAIPQINHIRDALLETHRGLAATG